MCESHVPEETPNETKQPTCVRHTNKKKTAFKSRNRDHFSEARNPHFSADRRSRESNCTVLIPDEHSIGRVLIPDEHSIGRELVGSPILA
jgi:hypothetical protein